METVEKNLSREVLEDCVVLVLEVVVAGDTGLKSLKSHMLGIRETLV